MKLFYLLLSLCILDCWEIHLLFWCPEVCSICQVGASWHLAWFSLIGFLWRVAYTFYHFLLITWIHFAYSFGLIKVELDKSLDLALTRFKISKVKIETSWYNTKHLFFILLTVVPETINQPNFIRNNLMIRQMIQQLFINRIILILRPCLFPT